MSAERRKPKLVLTGRVFFNAGMPLGLHWFPLINPLDPLNSGLPVLVLITGEFGRCAYEMERAYEA